MQILLEEESLMSTKTDIETLSREVERLGKLFVPTSWVGRNPARAWLISTTVAIGAVLVAIFGFVSPHLENDMGTRIENQVNRSLQAPLAKQGTMAEDIAAIKSTLNAWGPFITPQIFKRSIALPQKEFEKSLPQLKAAAQLGSQSKTPMSTSDIAGVGKRAISLASGSSDTASLAWETTTALLQYRSVLNNFNPPKGLDAVKPIDSQAVITHYHNYTEPGHTLPKFSIANLLVPGAKAAAMDYIGTDQNKDLPMAWALLVAEGGSVKLDKMHLRSVVLVNVHVIYRGTGPVILENVYFLNCTFDITNDSKGVQLASEILTSLAPSISASLS